MQKMQRLSGRQTRASARRNQWQRRAAEPPPAERFEVGEAVEEETSVGDEEASIATMITTTNTVVAAVE